MNATEYREHLQAQIPPTIMGALRRYQQEGISPGSCTTAILCGDLFGAVTAADTDTASALAWIALYVYLYMPQECWGSRDAVSMYQRRLRAEYIERGWE